MWNSNFYIFKSFLFFDHRIKNSFKIFLFCISIYYIYISAHEEILKVVFNLVFTHSHVYSDSNVTVFRSKTIYSLLGYDQCWNIFKFLLRMFIHKPNAFFAYFIVLKQTTKPNSDTFEIQI